MEHWSWAAKDTKCIMTLNRDNGFPGDVYVALRTLHIKGSDCQVVAAIIATATWQLFYVGDVIITSDAGRR